MFRKLMTLSLTAAALLIPTMTEAQCTSQTISDRSAMWKTGVNIPVWFDDPTMLTQCQSQFQSVLSNWAGSGANDQFGVSFSFTNDPNAFGAVRVYHAFAPSDPNKAGEFQPWQDADTTAPGMLDAKLFLSTSLQGCGALAGTFAHEIGHGFGLADCYGTGCSGTVMQQQQSWNWTGPLGPTTCDVNGVQHYLDPILMFEQGQTSCSAPKICPLGQVLEPSFCLCHVPAKPDPLLIDVDGDGIDLTSAADGVDFDFEGYGVRRHAAWTRAGSDDGWLALDRNGNGRIDDGFELFGDLSPQPASATANGIAALAVYDEPRSGGNGDGRLTAADPIYASLLVWQDRNHDGVAQAEEVRPLSATGVTAIELQTRVSERRDPNGNFIRYRARVESDRNPGRGRWAYDVFLQTTD